MSSTNHKVTGAAKSEIPTDGDEAAILERTGESDRSLERRYSQLEAATRAAFGVLNEAKQRTDLPLILQSVDRVIAIVELGARLDLESATLEGRGDG